jgi:DNA-binding IclR family transcriptional regulator
MVKSANRILSILEIIGASESGLTHADITAALQIPKSTLTALLFDLIDQEYILQNKLSKRFTLGPKILILAGKYLENTDVVGYGRNFVNEISKETTETVTLTIRIGFDALVAYKVDSAQPILPNVQVGIRLPLYASAAGKVMLAFFSEEEIEQYLNSVDLVKFTPKTIVDREQITADLIEIRRSGLAYNREGFREGITAIAAPVFDHQRKVVASVTISALTFLLDSHKEKIFEKRLLEIANRFSHVLGYSD